MALVEREQETGEDIALSRAAVCENRLTRTTHMRRLRIVADHLQRKIGLDAGAHVERACVNQRPAAMIALNAPQIHGDQALEFEIGLFATEMPEQHIFCWDRGIGLEFKTPMAILVLSGEQGFRRARDMTLERLERRRILENGLRAAFIANGSSRGGLAHSRLRQVRLKPPCSLNAPRLRLWPAGPSESSRRPGQQCWPHPMSETHLSVPTGQAPFMGRRREPAGRWSQNWTTRWRTMQMS